jgi:hypothetical protein
MNKNENKCIYNVCEVSDKKESDYKIHIVDCIFDADWVAYKEGEKYYVTYRELFDDEPPLLERVKKNICFVDSECVADFNLYINK